MVAGKNLKGASLALPWAQARRWPLLPAQNATGNFVKVVQRLPVRIDVMDYEPDKWPLFPGLSVHADGRFEEGAPRTKCWKICAGAATSASRCPATQ